MLLLTRRAGEAILIGDGIRLIVLATERGQVRLGIEAPPEVTILRQEIVDAVTEGTRAAVATPEGVGRFGVRRDQPAPRSRPRAAASVGADQSTVPSAPATTISSPATRKVRRKAAAPAAAESQAASS